MREHLPKPHQPVSTSRAAAPKAAAPVQAPSIESVYAAAPQAPFFRLEDVLGAVQRMETPSSPAAADHTVIQRTDLSEDTEREPVLDAIQEAENAGGLPTGTVAKVRQYIETLTTTKLATLGRAIDAVERVIEENQETSSDVSDTDDTETVDESPQKRIIMKARLLMRIFSGEATAEILAEPMDMMSQESRLAHFDIEDLADEATEEDTSLADVKDTFTKKMLDLGLKDLEQEIVVADKALSGVNLVMLASAKINEIKLNLKDWKPMLAHLGKFGAYAIKQESDKDYAQKWARAVKAHFLLAALQGWVKPGQVASLEFTDMAEYVKPEEKTDKSVDEALGSSMIKAEASMHRKAMEDHLADRKALKQYILDGAQSTDDVVFRNTCQWLAQGKSLIFAITKTHDSAFRAERSRKAGWNAWFPNFEKGPGDVFHSMPDYSGPDYGRNILLAPPNFGGGQQGKHIGVPAAANLIKTKPDLLRGTLIHEIQHAADLHETDPFSMIQSEINAHLLEHAHGRVIGYLHGVGADETMDYHSLTWNKRVCLVFQHLEQEPAGYPYIAPAWQANEHNFRQRVSQIQGPSSPNPMNSPRIYDLFDAVDYGDADKVQAAISQLDSDDVMAVTTNPKGKATLEEKLLRRYSVATRGWTQLTQIPGMIRVVEPVLTRIEELGLESLYDMPRRVTIQQILAGKFNDLLTQHTSSSEPPEGMYT